MTVVSIVPPVCVSVHVTLSGMSVCESAHLDWVCLQRGTYCPESACISLCSRLEFSESTYLGSLSCSYPNTSPTLYILGSVRVTPSPHTHQPPLLHLVPADASEAQASPCLCHTCSWSKLDGAVALHPLVAGEVGKGTIGGSDADAAAVPGVLGEERIPLLVEPQH